MSLIAAMVSNRPRLALQALESYGGNEDVQPSEWFIITPKRQRHEMDAVEKAVGATVLTEEEVRQSVPADLRLVFAPSFGGLRNMALALAARGKRSIVFVDDDTKPLNDVFRRHEAALVDAALTIGKYDGHVGSASSTLLDLTHALEKRQDGRIGKEEFDEVRNLRLQGIPPIQRPVENAGAVGGNLGIHWKTARRQAFITLGYRVEDGTYALLCEGRIANPSVAQSAVVRHEKRGKKDGLLEELRGDWAGNALATWIVASRQGRKTDWKEWVAQVRRGLLLDYFAEKYAKAGFADAELDRIRDIKFDLSQKHAEAAAAEYEKVQTIWSECWEALG